MTTQECIDHIELFTQYDLGTIYGDSPTDEQLVFLLNWGTRLIGKFLKMYRPNIVFTIAESFEFDLRDTSIFDRKIVDLRGVIINGNKLQDRSGYYGLWTMAELEYLSPVWMTQAAGTPLRAVQCSNILYVHPKPTAAVVSAGECYVTGTVFPRARTADTDVVTGLDTELDIPEELHEAACFFAAAKGSLPQISEADAWQRLQSFNSEWYGIAQEIRGQNEFALVQTSALDSGDTLR